MLACSTAETLPGTDTQTQMDTNTDAYADAETDADTDRHRHRHRQTTAKHETCGLQGAKAVTVGGDQRAASIEAQVIVWVLDEEILGKPESSRLSSCNLLLANSCCSSDRVCNSDRSCSSGRSCDSAQQAKMCNAKMCNANKPM